MRFRTAGILSIVVIGGMFVLPRLMLSHFQPLGHFGSYPERLLLRSILFFSRFKWVLAVPIAATLFTVAAFTSTRELSTVGKVGAFIVAPIFLLFGVGIVVSSVLGFLSGDTTSLGAAFIPFALVALLTGMAFCVSGFKLLKRAAQPRTSVLG